VQHRGPVNTVERDPQFLHYLPPERFVRPLPMFDMSARKVPHVWVPPPRRRPVTQQQPICLTQNHGHDVVVSHVATMTVLAVPTVIASWQDCAMLVGGPFLGRPGGPLS
jgi:hypothetical protein